MGVAVCAHLLQRQRRRAAAARRRLEGFERAPPAKKRAPLADWRLIGGLVAAFVVGVALLVCCCLLCCRRSPKRAATKSKKCRRASRLQSRGDAFAAALPPVIIKKDVDRERRRRRARHRRDAAENAAAEQGKFCAVGRQDKCESSPWRRSAFLGEIALVNAHLRDGARAAADAQRQLGDGDRPFFLLSFFLSSSLRRLGLGAQRPPSPYGSGSQRSPLCVTRSSTTTLNLPLMRAFQNARFSNARERRHDPGLRRSRQQPKLAAPLEFDHD